MALLAAVNRGFLKKVIGSIGVGVYNSQAMKLVRITTASVKAIMTLGDVQPALGPSMMPNSREPSPKIDNNAPGMSILGALGSFDSGTKKWPATMAVMPMGMLTQNTDDQLKWASSIPPVIGPMATA